MKQTAKSYNSTLRPLSSKKQAVLDSEAEEYQRMLERSNGLCWICMVKKATEKNHSRDLKRFVPSCRECHAPNGKHIYLDEVIGGEDETNTD